MIWADRKLEHKKKKEIFLQKDGILEEFWMEKPEDFEIIEECCSQKHSI